MFDCGYRSDPLWWPSVQFSGQTLDALILANLDEDHVADFRDMRKNVGIGSVWCNDSITAPRLRTMKPDGMQDGVKAVYEYLLSPVALNLAVDLSPIKVTLFRNQYGAFTDTNNLSLLTFVEYGQFCIVFPGDLEIAGWKLLVRDPMVAALLARTNLFVTSHHGRETGCSDEVFDICRPNAFIISDKEMVYDSQATAAWYRQHAHGMAKILTSVLDVPETRYVFTTRNDGCLSIDVGLTGSFVLKPKSDRQIQPFGLGLSGFAGVRRLG